MLITNLHATNFHNNLQYVSIKRCHTEFICAALLCISLNKLADIILILFSPLFYNIEDEGQ